MSKIYQPPGAPFDFQYLDGVENALMRADSGASTIGTGNDLLVTIPIVPRAFNLNGKSLSAKFFGLINNAAGGNKRISLQFDGVTIFDTTLVAFNTSNFELEFFGMLRQDAFFQTRVTLETNPLTGTSSAVAKLARGDVFAFDPLIAHTITVFGEVANAADTVNVDCFRCSML